MRVGAFILLLKWDRGSLAFHRPLCFNSPLSPCHIRSLSPFIFTPVFLSEFYPFSPLRPHMVLSFSMSECDCVCVVCEAQRGIRSTQGLYAFV